MPEVFRVESSDIKNLSPLQLTKLLKILLYLEARSNGIAERAVEVSLNINVADGGEDGRIQWNGEPKSTNFLPSNFVQFQNKAVSEMGPTDCAKEIINSEGSVKHKVDEVLSAGGSYILFTTLELNQDQKDKRIEREDAIRGKLNELGKSYSSTATIKIYDASMIEGWVNKYIPAIVTVLKWAGRPLFPGMKTWEDWGQHPEFQTFDFIADESRENAIKSIRASLNNPGKCVRIIGLSGMGKTRLAYETFRDTDEYNDLSKRTVYIDSNANSSILGMVCDWIQIGLEGIIVVDNCNKQLHDKLRQETQRIDSKISLLTLDYNIENVGQTQLVHLKQMNDKYIEQMLEPVYGKKIRDLDRIVSFAQGFPQMAVLLADARLDRDLDMGRLTNDVLASKMLWGDDDNQSEEEEKILQGCALFDHFGFDDEASNEYEYIAKQIVNVDVNKFYSCVKKFEERGIIDRRGRYASLVPKPLAIRLAAEWWTRTRPQKQIEIIQADMPGRLIDSFCEQISRLDFLPQVKELTKTLCGIQSPFGQAEVILSDRGSRLFRSLVEVNPDATSYSLYRILNACTKDEIEQITGDTRRNLVWALEKLCFHKSCFNNAVESLILFASSENEKWSNNSTGIFKQLFYTFLSGTEAPPSMRLEVIDNLLASTNIAKRGLAIIALENAIITDNITRSIGAEYQGSGEPLKEWRPKIWGEVFKYWEEALNRLHRLIIEKDPLAGKAKEAIASNIRGLVQHGRIDILDKIIMEVMGNDGKLWPEAIDSIKDILQYDANNIPEAGKETIKKWLAILTPTNLDERLVLTVSIPPYEHEKDDEGHYLDIAAQNAKKLAQELAYDPKVLVPYLNSILTGEQRQAYCFGKNLVESSGKWEPILFETIKVLKKLKDPNINFLIGILNGVFIINPDEWVKIVKKIYDDQYFNSYYSQILNSGNVTIELLYDFLKLLKDKKTDAFSAKLFSYGRSLEHLKSDDVTRFVIDLAKISDETSWVAIEILFMYCYQKKERWDNSISTFKEIIILPKLFTKEKKRKQREMHYWHDSVKRLLKEDDPGLAIKISKQIVTSVDGDINFSDLWHYVQPVIHILFQNYAREVWTEFSAAIMKAPPLERYKYSHFLGSSSFNNRKPSVLADLPDTIVVEWCNSYPDVAPEFIADITDVLLEDGDQYKISPRALFLIDNYGDDKKVLSMLSSNLSSFGWSGSFVPYLKKEKKALEILKAHKNKNVKEWVNNRISYLDNMISSETVRDEEHDWGVF